MKKKIIASMLALLLNGAVNEGFGVASTQQGGRSAQNLQMAKLQNPDANLVPAIENAYDLIKGFNAVFDRGYSYEDSDYDAMINILRFLNNNNELKVNVLERFSVALGGKRYHYLPMKNFPASLGEKFREAFKNEVDKLLCNMLKHNREFMDGWIVPNDKHLDDKNNYNYIKARVEVLKKEERCRVNSVTFNIGVFDLFKKKTY